MFFFKGLRHHVADGEEAPRQNDAFENDFFDDGAGDVFAVRQRFFVVAVDVGNHGRKSFKKILLGEFISVHTHGFVETDKLFEECEVRGKDAVYFCFGVCEIVKLYEFVASHIKIRIKVGVAEGVALVAVAIKKCAQNERRFHVRMVVDIAVHVMEFNARVKTV